MAPARKSDGLAKRARSAKPTAKSVRTSKSATRSREVAGEQQSPRAKGGSSKFQPKG